MQCSMPGTSTPGSGITFSTTTTLQSLDFAPGAVPFNGVVVEFDGSEMTYLAADYNSDIDTPPGGPVIGVVSGTGVVSGGGGGGGGGGGCRVGGSDVPLGPTFSPDRLDVLPGPGVQVTGTILDWDSTAEPQLNGYTVSAQGPVTISSVDAVNGIVNFSMNGSIVVVSQAVPALSMLGSMCLAIGLFGLALLALLRKRSATRAGGV
jgi:hypothetical protein